MEQYNDRVGPVGSRKRKAHKKKWKAQQADSQVDEGIKDVQTEGLQRDLRVMRRKSLDMQDVAGADAAADAAVKTVTKGKEGIERAKKSGGIYKKFGYPGNPTADQHAAAKKLAAAEVPMHHGTEVALDAFVDDAERRVAARRRIARERSPESKARTKAGRRRRVQTKRELAKRYPGKGATELSHTEYEGPSLAEDSKKGYPGIKGGTKAAKKEMKRRTSLGEQAEFIKEVTSRAGRGAGGTGVARAHTTKPPLRRGANPDPHREFKADPVKGIVRTKAGKVKRKKFGTKKF